MATIDISRSHALPLEQAKAKAEELAKSMEEKLGLVWRWTGDLIAFEAPSGAAKGVKGEVSVTSDRVRVTVDLPFLLRAIKGKIEDRIRRKMAEIL